MEGALSEHSGFLRRSFPHRFVYLFPLLWGRFSLEEQEVKAGPLVKCVGEKDVKSIGKRDSPHPVEGLVVAYRLWVVPQCLVMGALTYRKQKATICGCSFAIYCSAHTPHEHQVAMSSHRATPRTSKHTSYRFTSGHSPALSQKPTPSQMPVTTDKERGQDPFLYHVGPPPNLLMHTNSAIPGRVLSTKSKTTEGRDKTYSTHNHIYTINP